MIYFILSPETNTVKIGYTANDVTNRLAQLQTGNPVFLTVIGIVEGDLQDEKTYHQQFAEYRQQGEWFTFGEKIRKFITKLNTVSDITVSKTDATVIFNNLEKSTVKLAKIIKNSDYKSKIKIDKITNKYFYDNNGEFVLFDFVNFKNYVLEHYDFLPTDKQLNEVLPIVAETVKIPNAYKFKDYTAFELLLIEYVEDNFISQNKPFILNEVLIELNVKPANYVKTSAKILKQYFKLQPPTMSVVDSKRARWWNKQ